MERVATARPLIPGEYTFVVEDNWQALQQCGYVAHTDFTVDVTAQGRATHEFFFDPVTVGSTVAADSSKGVLKPASFTGADGVSATIRRIAWEAGTVNVSVTPHNALARHTLEFIELDGSVSLSLNVDDAMKDTSAGTLTWQVPDQPWHHGDLLMVRIRRSPPTPPSAPTGLRINPGTPTSSS